MLFSFFWASKKHQMTIHFKEVLQGSKMPFLTFLLILSSIITSFGQTGSLSGTIIDKNTEEPLVAVTISIDELGIGTISDLDGQFEITDLPFGKYAISYSYLGYSTLVQQVNISDATPVLLNQVLLEEEAIGLEEVQVFSRLAIDRKTPVAISAINNQDIRERFDGVPLPQIAQSTPGVYAIQGAGGYGDSEVYIRGFDQTNVAFLINGIPVNDMENGRMFWSNFAGLNTITRQMQVQRGLGASKLAISSIGGTVNMITKPAERGEGGRIEFQNGTGSWNNRFRFTYNTGLSDNGWAVSFQGSRTTTSSSLIGLPSQEQGSVVPGAFTDAWSYYLAVSKRINEKHTVNFWGFGAPVNRGTAWTPDDGTRETFNLTDIQQNNALGIWQGELFNARQNKIHKPLMALTHYWDKDQKTTITTSVYLSLANVFSTQPRDADNSLFFPVRRGINDFEVDEFQAFTSDNLIDWDYLSTFNRNNLTTVEFPNGDASTPSIQGNASRFYLESRHNNHEWIGLISNMEKRIDNVNLIAGVDLRHYKGVHFAEVNHLFGGDFVLNRSAFGDELNKLEPNGIARVGDRINYDYDGIVDWAAAFVQAEVTKGNFDLFGTASFTQTWYKRIGKFWNGRDIYNTNSLGESEQQNYSTYTLKAGANYRPSNRHNIYVNGGFFTRPPFFRDTYSDARFTNEIREGLTTEKVYAVEAGYGYRTGKIRANVNAYFTNWKDRTTTFEADGNQFQNLSSGEEVPFVLTGLRSEHKGVEFDFVYNATPALEINGYLSLGDWQWAEDVEQELTIVQNGETITQVFPLPLKGLPASTVAQTTAGIGLHYRGLKSMYIGGRWNFSDDIFIQYNPEDILEGFITRDVILEGFDAFSDFSIYAGRYFNLGDKLSGRISASVNNLLNAEYVRWASFFFGDTQRAYGYPRTFNIGLSLDF